MPDDADLRSMYERAMADCAPYVAACAETDLASGTPCRDWDLAALLSHVIGQNNGFALAVATGDAPPAAYDGPTIAAGSVVAHWTRSATAALDAFRRTPADRQVTVAGFGTFPVRRALRMQLLDTVVHAWDIAASVGRDHRPADDLVAFSAAYAAEIAGRTPTGQPGVFAPPVPVAGDDAWLDALRQLGRDPR